jgi:hypothetical protein
MRIAIPSHNRAGLIGTLTLAYLKRCGIEQSSIDVFISNRQQYHDYNAAGIQALCGNIIIANTDNVRDKFNFIHSYYPAGTEVLVIEDDIESIQRLAGYNKLEEELELLRHASIGFDYCKSNATKLWGISSNNNPFFLKDQASFCFKMVVANMYGFIAEQPPLLVTQHTKTDYERTILYTLKYGGVIRLDYLCPMTRNYKNPGGMQDLSDATRAAQEEQASKYLASTYPELCKLNTGKSSKFAEVSLLTKRVKPNQNNTLFDGI